MNSKKKTILFIAIIMIVAVITMMPLFTSSYKSGHDTKFHITNIDSLTEQIEKDFLSFSPIVPHIANDFGYGTSLFYPPFAHTFASYINVAINSETISLKIVHFLGLFASGITMFFLARKVSKSDELGLLSSVIYMLFPYHISNIYIRDALGEELLFIFLPMIIQGLYELFNNNRKAFYPLFIFGYIGGMLCHLTLMVYFTIPIVLFLIWKWKDTLKNIWPLLLSSVLILGITSFFTVGLLEQRFLGNYRVFQDGVMVQGTQGHGLLFDYINIFNHFGDNEIKYFIDAIVLVLLGVTIYKHKKIEDKINKKFYLYIGIFGILFIILSLNKFPWDIFPRSFRIFQYPWRFETFVSLAVSLIAPLCLNLMQEKKLLTFTLVALLTLFIQANLKSASEEVINLNYMEYVYGMGYQQEYLPVKLGENREYLDERDHYVHILNDKEGSVTIIKDEVPYLSFKVDSNEVIDIEMPRIYYIGYTLKDTAGNKIELKESDKGFIQASVNSGEYILDFTGTTLDIISRYVSITLTVSFILGYIVWRKKYEKN